MNASRIFFHSQVDPCVGYCSKMTKEEKEVGSRLIYDYASSKDFRYAIRTAGETIPNFFNSGSDIYDLFNMLGSNDGNFAEVVNHEYGRLLGYFFEERLSLAMINAIKTINRFKQ